MVHLCTQLKEKLLKTGIRTLQFYPTENQIYQNIKKRNFVMPMKNTSFPQKNKISAHLPHICFAYVYTC